MSFCSHFFIIGAPRFELGTSSPPGLSSEEASSRGEWREVVFCRQFRSVADGASALQERIASGRLGTDWAQNAERVSVPAHPRERRAGRPPVFVVATPTWRVGDEFFTGRGEFWRILGIETELADELVAQGINAVWTVEPI
jgi:hypothetical protein